MNGSRIKFIAEPNSERNFKIGQHFSKLWTSDTFLMAHSVYEVYHELIVRQRQINDWHVARRGGSADI